MRDLKFFALDCFLRVKVEPLSEAGHQITSDWRRVVEWKLTNEVLEPQVRTLQDRNPKGWETPKKGN